MSEAETRFQTIRDELIATHPQVEAGKMMSSPAMTYKSKVFAFYYDEEMTFRLGRDYDPARDGIQKWDLLNPFKNKPPMADWFRISFEDEAHWAILAYKALDRIKADLDG